MGQNPTDAEVEAIEKQFNTEEDKTLSLSRFMAICCSPHFRDPMKEEVLLDALKAFDAEGRGAVRVEALRRGLMVLGEPIDPHMANEFLDFAVASGDSAQTGEINSEVLVRELVARDPGMQFV